MIYYRTNARLSKIVKHDHGCMLEAIVFATGLCLSALNLLRMHLAHGLDAHTMNRRLRGVTSFQLVDVQ
eukprot:5885543-Prymnesium_polylepis.1